MGKKVGGSMRKRLWTAAALLAMSLLAASVFGVYRATQQVRHFADRIHVPLATGSGDDQASRRWPAANGLAESGALGSLLTGLSDRSESAHEVAGLERVSELDAGVPFVMLLIGVDRRPGDRGRSDALLAVSINPDARSTLIVSIPRDTRTTLAGLQQPRTDKINHAYAYGGVESTVATVEQFLGVPVSRYVQADMDGFRDMVDLLDGVQVDNGSAFVYEGFTFREGTLHLNGEEALAYVRMRKDDPRGDLGRNDRQKAVLGSLARAALRPDRVRLWPEMLEALSDHMRTDLTLADWKALLFHYRHALEQVETEQIAGTGRMLEGIYYYIVSEQEQNRIFRRLAEHQQEAH